MCFLYSDSRYKREWVRESDKWPSPKLANKFGYSEDAAGRPTGPLAARLTRANVSIFLLRGRVTLRDLRLSPSCRPQV